jgi:hypothetical protein
MSKRKWYPIIAFGLLALAVLMCNGEEEAEKVGEVGEAETSEEATAAPSFFKVGDVVKKGDHQVTLNECNLSGGLLTCILTVENVGEESFTVSSLMEFDARDGEGQKLEMEWDCSPGLDGEVAPGDKLKGKVCFSGASLPAKLYYEAGLFTDAIVFEITE